MKKLLTAACLVLGLFFAAPAAYAGGHVNHGHAHHGHAHHGHVNHGHAHHGHVNRGHVNHGHAHHGHVNRGHVNHGHFNYQHSGPRVGFGIYVGPSYRYPAPYPRPYPNPYPRPYPRPYPSTVTVLVTDYCYGRVVTHYVTARWDNLRGGYWYYDCMGSYRRAR